MRQPKEFPAMLTSLKTAIFAGLIGLSGLAALPAQADSVYLGFGDRQDDARFGVYLGDSSRTHYPRERWRRDDGEWNGDWRGRRCSPGRALDKAASIGVRRPRIDYVTGRRIGVVGRQHGEWVQVTFARAPGCPVIGW